MTARRAVLLALLAAPAAGGALAQPGWQGLGARTDRPLGPAAPQRGPDAPPSGNWDALGARTEDLERAMAGLGARVEGDEIVVDLPGDVLFDFDRHDVRPDAAESLGRLRTVILAQPARGPVRIEGHTDSRGSDAYNQALSERRAAYVRAWLAARGVEPRRMTARGFGESRPVAPNARPDGRDDPEGRQRNRRVQVFVTRG